MPTFFPLIEAAATMPMSWFHPSSISSAFSTAHSPQTTPTNSRPSTPLPGQTRAGRFAQERAQLIDLARIFIHREHIDLGKFHAKVDKVYQYGEASYSILVTVKEMEVEMADYLQHIPAQKPTYRGCFRKTIREAYEEAIILLGELIDVEEDEEESLDAPPSTPNRQFVRGWINQGYGSREGHWVAKRPAYWQASRDSEFGGVHDFLVAAFRREYN